MPICTLYSACPSVNSSFLCLALLTKLLPSAYSFISVKGFIILHCLCQTPGATLKFAFSLNLENVISHQILLILLPLPHCTLFHLLHPRPLLIQFLIISCLCYCNTFHFKIYITIRVNYLVSHIYLKALSFPS